jgi:predicted amidophosphoribosyltransferase
MNLFIQTLLNYVQRHIECPLCIRCGSYFVQENYFCTVCAQQFFSEHYKQRVTALTSNLNVISFIQWRRYQSDSLSEFIYLLKTKNSDLAWRWLVYTLEQQICQFVHPDPQVVLIPVPGSRTSYHTNYFCSAIQDLTGCKSVYALTKSTRQSDQKTLTAISRKSSKFLVSEEFTERLASFKQIYLVDDIITTGATLKNISEAIREALPEPKKKGLKICGLTLFYRER